MVKPLIVQTLQQTRSPKSGAIIKEWVNTTTIQGNITYTTTTKTVKDIRSYDTKAIILTKYPNLTTETNRLLDGETILKINYSQKGIFNVIHCEVLEVC